MGPVVTADRDCCHTIERVEESTNALAATKVRLVGCERNCVPGINRNPSANTLAGAGTYYSSCSPPAAEYALAGVCLVLLPTFPCWLRSSWERVVFFLIPPLPYWATGSSTPAGTGGTGLQLIGCSMADCQSLT